MLSGQRLFSSKLLLLSVALASTACAATSEVGDAGDDPAPIGVPLSQGATPARGPKGSAAAPSKAPTEGDDTATTTEPATEPNATPQPAGDTNASAGAAPSQRTPTPSSPATTPVQAAGCPLGQQTNGNTGGPSTCCSGSYLVCDDFEAQADGGEPNRAYWVVEKIKGGSLPQSGTVANTDGAAVVEVSSARAARGKKSLHIRVPNDGTHHDNVVNRSAFPAPNNSFWGRAFIYYVSDAQSAVPNIHVNYASASGTVRGSTTFYNWTRLASFYNPQSPTVGINYGRGDTAVYSGAHVPTNRWACLEWQFDGTANNRVALYLDGAYLTATTKAIASQDNPQNVAPAYDAFRLGYEIYGRSGNSPSFEVYFDEVALASSRIGCAN